MPRANLRHSGHRLILDGPAADGWPGFLVSVYLLADAKGAEQGGLFTRGRRCVYHKTIGERAKGEAEENSDNAHANENG